MQTQEPGLLHFTDFRAFLLHYADRKRQQKRTWSLGSWSRQLKLRSTASLTKILNGDRHPNADTTEKFIEHFAFNPREASYFRDLVELSRLKNQPQLKSLLIEKLQNESQEEGPRFLDEEEFFHISRWYGYAIREMVRLPLFRENPQWIVSKFISPVAETEVTNIISTLIRLGLLKRNKQKKLEPTDYLVSTTDDISSRALRSHHIETLEQTIDLIESLSPQSREVTNTTYLMSESELASAKESLRNFKKKFIKKFDNPRGDTVYRIQLQLLPLTKPITKKS